MIADAATTATSWKPENWIAFGSAIVTALLTAAGLYWGPKLAVKRSLEQFRSQKIWEKQQETYTSLLDDLATIYGHYLGLLDEIVSGAVYHPSTDVLASVESARIRLEVASIRGAHIISDTIAKALNNYQKQMYVADSEIGKYSACEIICKAAKGCIETIRQEANPSSI